MSKLEDLRTEVSELDWREKRRMGVLWWYFRRLLDILIYKLEGRS